MTRDRVIQLLTLCPDSTEPHWVYFAHQGDLDLLKIGMTSNLTQRMSTLDCFYYFALPVCSKQCALEVERIFHHEFQETRLPQSEWFVIGDHLDRFLDEILSSRATFRRLGVVYS